MIVSAPELSAEIQNFKSYTARKIIDLLKQSGATSLLRQLRATKLRHKTQSEYQIWQEGGKPKQIQNDDMMWQKIREGKVDCMGSDHVAYPLAFKQGDIWQSMAGIPGIQTMIPLLLSEGVNKGRIDLPQLVKVTSEGPARVCGLYPRKGSTQIGADADLAVFDLKNEREVKLEEQYKLEWTLYDGKKAVYPDKVFVRGKNIVDGGKVVGERGFGAFCSPTKGL